MPWDEAVPVVLVSAPIGVLLGYAYAAVILQLLAGPWSGVVHTDGFAIHANIMTVVLSFILSVILAFVVLALTVRGAQKLNGESQKSKVKSQKSKGEGQNKLSIFNYQLSILKYFRHQHRLSFITLALGVLTVFAVGVNRPDFSHSSESATGGYQYYGESRIPLQYDLNTAAGRHHLHLDNLPSDLRFLQLPKHTEDEASCMNLNHVENPSVFGMSLEDMKSFGINISEVEGVKYKVDSVKWNCEADELANKEESKCTIPIAVDSEALLWSMMKKVGDTLIYHASDGRKVNVVIAAEYPTGIFHGNAIMPIDCFRQLWPDEMGSRVVLVKVEGQKSKGESQRSKVESSNPSPLNTNLSILNSTLTTSLSDYGFTLIPSVERLLHFFEVTDTYLRIFLSLGLLGLMLGLVSLLIVIRKNLVARSEEIRLYHALGFPTATIVRMFRCEQLIVPLLAILTGAGVCLLISVLLPTFNFSLSTFLLCLLPIIVFTCIIIYISITTKTIRQCETC